MSLQFARSVLYGGGLVRRFQLQCKFYSLPTFLSPKACIVHRVQRPLTTNAKKDQTDISTKKSPDNNADNSYEAFFGLISISVMVLYAIYELCQTDADQLKKIEHENESTTKKEADSLPGTINVNGGNIKRVKQSLRLHLDILDANGVGHGRLEGTSWYEKDSNLYYQQPYWNDEAAYALSKDAALTIRNATWNLHAMCLEAVDLVVGIVIAK